jgi:hypothetical protein
LFNLVVDVLTRMLEKAAENNLVKGLLMTLQYADDIVLFSSIDKNYVTNLKGVLLLFEAMSRMRINFHKSKVILMNTGEEEAHGIAHMLSCSIGSLPFRYLGVPLHHDKLRIEDM